MSDAAKLMTQQTDFSKLAERYENFMVPAAHITINGTRLEKLDIIVESLSINLSLDNNSCSFTMYNVYEDGKDGFRKEAVNISRPGSVIQVEIGYGSSLMEVFYGYIHEANFEIGSKNTISVTALDVRRLMQEQNAFLKKYAEEDAKSVVNKILTAYSPLIKTIHWEGEWPDKIPPLQKGNDLDYIKAICRECDMEFLILGSECFIRPMDAKQSVIMTMEGNRSLISFSKSMIYKDLTLKTRVLDEAGASQGKKQTSPITLEVKTHKKYINDLGIRQEQFILSDRTDDAKTAGKRLDRRKHELLQNAQGGNGVSVGLPDLVPGRYIEITSLDDVMNGIYYLNNVTHSMSGNEFKTSFQIGGYGE